MEARRIRRLAATEISDEEISAADEVLYTKKVALFIVAYNAEKHLENLVERIPPSVFSKLCEIFIIDDSSRDSTYEIATKIRERYFDSRFRVYKTPFNRGYGGNQKLGYLYSIKNSYDVVVLLHGDGQYPPEYLQRLIAPFRDPSVDAVFASRMLNKKQALAGGMPVYKWIGNQILTSFENKLLGSQLSEFHTGFRAYRVSSLKTIPFEFNSDDFHFDTEIIIQAHGNNWKIHEVSIPTHYGDEVCHVNGFSYAYNCVKAVIKFRLVLLGLFYQRNFDLCLFENEQYHYKTSPNSLHQYLLKALPPNPAIETVEFGANRGHLSNEIARRVQRHFAVDKIEPDQAGTSEKRVIDLNTTFAQQFSQKFDCCIALDVIEHLDEPENFLKQVFEVLKVHGRLYISTANIAYLPMRLSLLLGQFNYGKRGILDRTHKRLFSVASFRRLIGQYGFRIESVRGFSPPFADMISNTGMWRTLESLHSWFSRKFPGLFAFNFLIIAERLDGLSEIFQQTIDQLQRSEKEHTYTH